MENSLLRLLALDRLSIGLGAGEVAKLIDANAPLMQKLMALEEGSGASSASKPGEGGGETINPHAALVDYYNASAHWLTRSASRQPGSPEETVGSTESDQLHIGRHLITRTGSPRVEIGQCFVSLVDRNAGIFQERFLIKMSEREAWLTGADIKIEMARDGAYTADESRKKAAEEFLAQREALAGDDALTMTVTYRYCAALQAIHLTDWNNKAVLLKHFQPKRALFEVSSNGGGWLLREMPRDIPEYEVIDHWCLDAEFIPSRPGETLTLRNHSISGDSDEKMTILKSFFKAATAITSPGWYVRVAYRMDQI